MEIHPEFHPEDNIPTSRYHNNQNGLTRTGGDGLPYSSSKPSLTERYARWVIRYRWLVMAVIAIVTGIAAIGAAKLDLANDYRVFFSKDNPDLAAFEAVENIYTKNDNVLFVIRPSRGDVFQPKVLAALRELTEDAWQIPHSTRVDGITNFQHTWADGDELIVEDLVPDGEITPAVAERARQVATAEPLLAGRLVSPDQRTTGINVRISLPGESKDELPETVAYVRMLLDKYRSKYGPVIPRSDSDEGSLAALGMTNGSIGMTRSSDAPELEIHASGIAMMNAAFSEAPMRDMPFVMPLMFAAFVLAIILFLRSWPGIVSTLTVLLMSTAAAMGIAGHFGVLLDPVSASAPTIILTLAVADSIHLLVTWMHYFRNGATRNEALAESLRVNAKAVFLTSITTTIGFLSLNFSDSPPFRLLGNVTALGVMIAWAYSMTLLPALIAVLPAKARQHTGRGRIEVLVDRIGDVIVRRYKPILAATAIIAILLSISIGRLRINDQYIDYFDRSLPVRVASDFTVRNLSGIYSTTYSLDSGSSQGITDPDYLAKVDSFADYLESRPNVVHVNSFTRTMKRLNMNLHADDPAQYKLPENNELAAQYLLLYEMSLPYGLDVNDQIDVDKSSLRIDVTYGDVDMSDVENESRLASAWLNEHGTASMRGATATGVPVMFGKITRRNISSMILGTGLGFLLIALVLVVALRSVRMGVISLIPNILPAGMAFGVWALLIHDVGFAVSVVAGLSLGIIVDDTVHFLAKYTRARRENGLSAPDAVRYAFRTVGTAILGTTFIVAVGFAMLGLSSFRVTSYMGLMTSLTVICALFVDFLLLPTLLLAFDRGGSKREKVSVQPSSNGVEPVAVAVEA